MDARKKRRIHASSESTVCVVQPNGDELSFEVVENQRIKDLQALIADRLGRSEGDARTGYFIPGCDGKGGLEV